MGTYDDCILVGLHIQEDTYKKFKLYCLKNDTTVKAMAKKALEDFMKNNPSSKKKKTVKKA